MVLNTQPQIRNAQYCTSVDWFQEVNPSCGGCLLDQSLFGRFNPTTAGLCQLS